MQSRAYSNSSDEIGIRPDIPVEAVRCVACVSTKEWVLALERGELDGPATEKEKADIARFNNTVANDYFRNSDRGSVMVMCLGIDGNKVGGREY
jgi:hypothetical protein